MSSFVRNYFYNLLVNGANILFPLILLPYTTRVLGPEGLGVVNFYQGFTQFFVLFGIFGFQVYGVREIVQAGKDKNRLSTTISSLFVVNVLATIFSIVVYIVIFFFWPPNINKDVAILFTMSILFSSLSFDWLFIGIEAFKSQLLRNFFTKLFVLVAVVLFVHNGSDLYLYTTIIILGLGVNSAFGLFAFWKLTKFRSIPRALNSVFRGSLPYMAITIVSSFTVLFPQIALGSIHGPAMLNYFVIAYSLIGLVLTLAASVNTVLMPRSAKLVLSDKDNFSSYISKGLNLIVLVSLPISFGVFAVGDQLVVLLAGERYREYSYLIKILAPAILFSMASTFLTQQLIYPYKREKVLVLISLANMVLVATAGYFAIVFYGPTGASLAWLGSECLVFVVVIWFSVERIGILLNWVTLLKSIAASSAMALLVIGARLFLGESMISLIAIVIIGAVTYIAAQLLLQRQLVIELLRVFFPSKPS